MYNLEIITFCFAPFVVMIIVAVFIEYLANKADKY